MTYKKYLKKYFVGRVGNLDESGKNGLFIFYCGVEEERSWGINQLASSQITHVEDDFVVVKVWNDGNETPHSRGAHFTLIPLSSFIFNGPFTM